REGPLAPPPRQRLEDEWTRALDVACADREDQVAGTRSPGKEASTLLDGRRPGHVRPGPELGERVDDELPAHTLDRLLPRRVDVRDCDRVGGCERLREVAREVLRARVEVRLEEREQAAIEVRPRGRKIGG